MSSARRILLMIVAVVGLTVIATPSAHADSATGGLSSASFQPASPATAGSGDSTTVLLSFTYGSGSDTAKSLDITFPPGFLAAPAAVATTCSSVQLAASACPSASEIGTGQATVGTIVGNQTATLGIYLMPPPTSDAVVGIGVELNAMVFGLPITTTGCPPDPVDSPSCRSTCHRCRAPCRFRSSARSPSSSTS
jgi:hypothetical protein